MRTKLLLTFTVSLWSFTNIAQSWQPVGPGGFSPGKADYPTMAIDKNDSLFVAYSDYTDSSQVKVKKFNGTDWVSLGSDFTPATSIYSPTQNSIVIDTNGVPYVAYVLGTMNVKKFDGTNWVRVGPSYISATSAGYPCIQVDGDNQVYASYMDGSFSSKATVKKFTGSNWVTVGSEGFTSGMAYFNSLAISKAGTPYLVYSDNSDSNQVTVMKYNGTGWDTVGSDVSTPYAGSITSSIAFDNSDVPYVAYTDYGMSGKLTVKKFDGVDWVVVGTRGFSGSISVWPSLKFDNMGTPLVAYRDAITGGKATLKKFTGTSWVDVGTPGFSAGFADYTVLAIDKSGNPYVSYKDNVNADKITVMKFDVTAGISEKPASFISSAYPNPTSGKLSIELGGYFNNIGVEVKNLLGETVQKANFQNTNDLELEIKGIKGMYFITISNNGKEQTLKVIKE